VPYCAAVMSRRARSKSSRSKASDPPGSEAAPHITAASADAPAAAESDGAASTAVGAPHQARSTHSIEVHN
jgi:hypothetical protein